MGNSLCSFQTLDFISEVLARDELQNYVPSLASSFPGHSMGGWKAGRDFLRIDGSTTGAERGDLVKEFNEDLSSVRLFLISSRAGGMGINLCSANRVSDSFLGSNQWISSHFLLYAYLQVVLFDSHFNPTIDEQAVSTG
jgi:hypothetical protein